MLRQFLSTLSPWVLGIALGWGWQIPVWANSPETAPAELTSALNQIEAASNTQDLNRVMTFYSDTFSSPEGFDKASLEETVARFWEQYTDLSYGVELVGWEPINNGFIAETITRVEGTQVLPQRRLSLAAEVRSRQRFESGKIVSQEVLSEQSQLTSGENPPNLTIILPAETAPGEMYEFDAIVEEPLGDRSLLGVALEEGVTATDFLTPRPVTLEGLTAGGLFKLGQAPDQSDQRWVSAVIVREDGMTIETRRLRIGTWD